MKEKVAALKTQLMDLLGSGKIPLWKVIVAGAGGAAVIIFVVSGLRLATSVTIKKKNQVVAFDITQKKKVVATLKKEAKKRDIKMNAVGPIDENIVGMLFALSEIRSKNIPIKIRAMTQKQTMSIRDLIDPIPGSDLWKSDWELSMKGPITEDIVMTPVIQNILRKYHGYVMAIWVRKEGAQAHFQNASTNSVGPSQIRIRFRMIGMQRTRSSMLEKEINLNRDLSRMLHWEGQQQNNRMIQRHPGMFSRTPEAMAVRPMMNGGNQ